MGADARSAAFYDVLYGDKDSAAEAQLLADLIREHSPEVRSILDVGCGTGAHARCLIDAGFEVDGVDVEPAFVELARAKCPEASFQISYS